MRAQIRFGQPDSLILSFPIVDSQEAHWVFQHTQIKAISRYPIEMSMFLPQDTLFRCSAQSRIPDASIMPDLLAQRLRYPL
jgi:hypothetical protein